MRAECAAILMAGCVGGTVGCASHRVVLRNDCVEVVVAPEHGRIVRYGFLGDANVLWTLENAEAYAPKIGNWNNWGGDKAWIWPQDDWRGLIGRGWPPPNEAERVERVERQSALALRLVSPVVPGYGVRIVRDLALAPTGSELTVKTRLVPEPGTPGCATAFAAWTITQVSARNDGVYARAASTNAAWLRLGATPLPAPTPIGATRIVRVRRDPADSGKSGFDGDAFAVRFGTSLYVQRTAPYAPGAVFGPGDRAQIYAAADVLPCFPATVGAYLELEFTAPVAPRAEAESQALTTVWSLHRLPQEATDATVADLLETSAAD